MEKIIYKIPVGQNKKWWQFWKKEDFSEKFLTDLLIEAKKDITVLDKYKVNDISFGGDGIEKEVDNAILDELKKTEYNEDVFKPICKDTEELNILLNKIINSDVRIRKKIVILKRFIDAFIKKNNDYKIKNTIIEKVDKVTEQEITNSLKYKFYLIDKMNNEFISDEDFGRNVRILIINED